MAFHRGSQEFIDKLARKLSGRGCHILYEEDDPYAGGPDYYPVIFEDLDRMKVEITTELSEGLRQS